MILKYTVTYKSWGEIVCSNKEEFTMVANELDFKQIRSALPHLLWQRRLISPRLRLSESSYWSTELITDTTASFCLPDGDRAMYVDIEVEQ